MRIQSQKLKDKQLKILQNIKIKKILNIEIIWNK